MNQVDELMALAWKMRCAKGEVALNAAISELKRELHHTLGAALNERVENYELVLKEQIGHIERLEASIERLDAALNTAALAESDAYLRGYNVGHEAALKNGGEPSLNYEPVFEFASKHRVSYNELCAVVRSACAAPPAQTPDAPSPCKPINQVYMDGGWYDRPDEDMWLYSDGTWQTRVVYTAAPPAQTPVEKS